MSFAGLILREVKLRYGKDSADASVEDVEVDGYAETGEITPLAEGVDTLPDFCL